MRTITCFVMLAVVAWIGPAPESAPGIKTTSSWPAADLRPATGGKFLALANITEEASQRILEDAVVKKLREAGLFE